MNSKHIWDFLGRQPPGMNTAVHLVYSRDPKVVRIMAQFKGHSHRVTGKLVEIYAHVVQPQFAGLNTKPEEAYLVVELGEEQIRFEFKHIRFIREVRPLCAWSA